MIKHLRTQFNNAFSSKIYKDFIAELNSFAKKNIEFRVAETPVFIDNDFKNELIKAGDELVKIIKKENFKSLTENAIPPKWKVANEGKHPHFLTFDFAVCVDEHQKPIPKLIELQGFPSLYGFQLQLAKSFRRHYGLNDGLSPYFSGLDEDSYISLLKKTIVGDCDPKEVILLDVDAYNQKTAVDFYITAQQLGIKVLALHDLKQHQKAFFYHDDGKDIRIKRIYNRLIFDEIEQNLHLLNHVPDLLYSDEIEWVTSPNWFYRISKYTMPFLNNEYVPETFFLSDVKTIPHDLENYVLKPLFSFAGKGVIIDVKEQDILQITEKEHWILQRKVVYEPVLQAPNGKVKCEIRLMYLWPEGDENPTLAINLARLSRGKMIGVSYNKDFDWVGGTVCLF